MWFAGRLALFTCIAGSLQPCSSLLPCSAVLRVWNQAGLQLWRSLHAPVCSDAAHACCFIGVWPAVTDAQTAAAAAAFEAAGVIAAEGADTAGTSSGAGLGQLWEVFFSRPAASMPALFRAVAAHAAAVE